MTIDTYRVGDRMELDVPDGDWFSGRLFHMLIQEGVSGSVRDRESRFVRRGPVRGQIRGIALDDWTC